MEDFDAFDAEEKDKSYPDHEPTIPLNHPEGTGITETLSVMKRVYDSDLWKFEQSHYITLVNAMACLMGTPSTYYLDHEQEWFREVYSEVLKFNRSRK